MTDRIHALTPRETMRHDPGPVAALYREHGARAPRVVRERLSALALRVALSSEQVAARDLDQVPAQLRLVQRMAAELGLISLAGVAATAAGLVGAPAFPAVWARLLRLTEAAIHPSRDLLKASQ